MTVFTTHECHFTLLHTAGELKLGRDIHIPLPRCMKPEKPYQGKQPFQAQLSVENRVLMQEEITSMIRNGVILELSDREAQGGFCSSMFLVPKRMGKIEI